MAHDVFISYEYHDRTVADAVCATLEAKGIRCWIAPRDVTPGKAWAEEIFDAINRSRLLVLVFSTNSNAAGQVLREVNLAADARIPILPFRIEDVNPAPALRFYVGPQHWLDALTPPLQRHLDELAVSAAALIRGDPYPAEQGERPANGGPTRVGDRSAGKPGAGGRRLLPIWPWIAGAVGVVVLGVAAFALAAALGAFREAPELVVVKPYGAALRKQPETNANNILTVAPCNAHLRKLGGPTPDEWYEVNWQGETGWVGFVRVAPLKSDRPPDCANAETYEPGELVITHGDQCMTPTYSAPQTQQGGCVPVPDGTKATVINGPVDPGDGVDRIEVRDALGDGWLPARDLAPAG